MTIMVIRGEAVATWGVAEAKAKFSALVERAQVEGPQQITKGGEPVAVVVSIDQWREIQRKEQPRESLVEFFRQSPAFGLDLEIKRIPLHPRRVDF